jgi:hypothetical protein
MADLLVAHTQKYINMLILPTSQNYLQHISVTKQFYQIIQLTLVASLISQA